MQKFVPKKDPPIRKDKKCHVCGKPLSPIELREVDPFCSTPCAREYHETQINRSNLTS